MAPKIPAKWDCGPDADEYASDRGEARQEIDDEIDFSGGSRHAAGPMHYSGYAALEGWREEW